jgi:putative transposase
MAAAGQRWRPVLGGRLKARCGEVLEQVAHEHAWQVVAKKVMPDRVHRSVRVGPTNAPASVVGTFKGRTARALRDEFPYMRRFAKLL